MADDSRNMPTQQRVLLSDKQAVPFSEKELADCNLHSCRQCNTRWTAIEPTESFLTGVARSPSLKYRCEANCRKYRWWYGALLCVLIVVIIIPSVLLRPHASVGLYKDGSGIVWLDRGDKSDVVDVFFQHASGQIRHGIWTEINQAWNGGTSSDHVLSQYAPRPRQGTPLMAVSYIIGDETTWRVFYVDVGNVLQESIGSTTSGDFPTDWSIGSLGSSHFNASTSAHTGFSVCQNMLWSPDVLGFNNGSLVLFYGGSDGNNHMLTHEIQDTAWNYNHTFEDSSSESGVECTCRGSSIVDAWMINKDGELSQQSFNFDLTSNSSAYPAGNWTSGTVYNGSMQVPTSVSAIKFTGNSTSSVNPAWKIGSTFVYIVTGDGSVNGVVADTASRTYGPALTQSLQHVNSPAIVNSSKIASVTIMTNSQNPISQEHGEESKVIIQTMEDPESMTIMTGIFDGNQFTKDEIEIGK